MSARLVIPELRRILFALNAGQKVNAIARRALGVLRSFIGSVKIKVDDVEFGLDIEPLKGEADSGDLEADLSTLFAAVAEAARAKEKAVLILIDEVQYLKDEDLSALIIAIHQITQRKLPLVLIGAGLPQLAGLAGNSKSYAERLFDYPNVGPLAGKDAVNALQEPIEREGASIDEDALQKIMQITQGYPYFLQTWGYQAWNTADQSPITVEDVDNATPIAIQHLDEGFFRVRFDRLTPTERRYLRAMAELGEGPHRSGDIAQLVGKEVQQAAPLRNGLLRKGMIYSPAHGDTAFTVPMFGAFLKRVMPEF